MTHELKILIKKIIRNFRDYGFFISSKKSIFYLIKSIYEKKNLALFEIDLMNIDGEEFKKSTFDFRFVKLKDTYIIKQIEDMEEWLVGKMESYIGKEKLCIAALKNNKVIGFFLISFGEIYLPLIYTKVILKKGEAFGEQITIHKNFRRKGLATELRYRAYSALKRKGKKIIYASSLVDNIASLRSIEKGGGQRIGQLSYKSVFRSKQLCLKRISGQEVFNYKFSMKDTVEKYRKTFNEQEISKKRMRMPDYLTKNKGHYYFIIDSANF